MPGKAKSLKFLNSLSVMELKQLLESVRSEQSNLDEAATGYKRKAKLLQKKARRLQKLLKEEKVREQRRQGFVGAPSSYRHFCFSSAVNKRIKNHQDIQDYDPVKKNPIYASKTEIRRAQTAIRSKRVSKIRSQHLENMKVRETQWSGVPFSTKKLSYSSTANRHIKNIQEYEQVTSFEPDRHVAEVKAHERWHMVPDREVFK